MAKRTGVWFIGAKGGVATTAIVGLLALKKGLTATIGLVSQLNEFADLDLLGWDDIVIGGHDIRAGSLVDEAQKLHTDSRLIDEHILAGCHDDLESFDKNIRQGMILNVGKTIAGFAEPGLRELVETPADAIARVQQDLKEFAETHELEQVIVVNLASTEPPADVSAWPETWEEFEKLLNGESEAKIPSSTLYAIAALDAGYPFINFTPSVGSAPAAIDDLARCRRT